MYFVTSGCQGHFEFLEKSYFWIPLNKLRKWFASLQMKLPEKSSYKFQEEDKDPAAIHHNFTVIHGLLFFYLYILLKFMLPMGLLK